MALYGVYTNFFLFSTHFSSQFTVFQPLITRFFSPEKEKLCPDPVFYGSRGLGIIFDHSDPYSSKKYAILISKLLDLGTISFLFVYSPRCIGIMGQKPRNHETERLQKWMLHPGHSPHLKTLCPGNLHFKLSRVLRHQTWISFSVFQFRPQFLNNQI